MVEDCSPTNMNIAVINTDGGALGSKVSTPAHLDTPEMPDPERVGEVSDSIEYDEIEGEPPVQTPPAVPTKWKALKLLAQVLAPATNIFGPIKETVGLFMECVDKHEMVGEATTEYKALRGRLEQLFEDLQTHFAEGGSLAVTYSIESLCKSIDAELTYIKTQQARNAGVLYLTLADEPDKILACYRRIEGHLQRLLLNANLSMWRIVQDQATNARSDRMSSLVDRLPSSLPAWYNSAEGLELKRRECTPGTRIVVLANLLGWARSGGGGVYWLNGMAGTGKTTIAYSVCANLDSRRQLGASFFCSRLREECRNVNLIIPSIAYQLARFSRPFQSALSGVLEKDPDVHGRLPQIQFDAMISRPILEVQHTLPVQLTVVIDALDECEQKESTGRMLDVLLSGSANLPIKFIVSSRPESQICDRMAERAKSRLVLHELDKGEVQTDIDRYLREGLAQMNPSEAQIAALVEKAGILFIYAATAVRYIGYDNFRSDPNDRLCTILSGSQSQEDGETKEIDQLYTTVLEVALGNQHLRKVERENMRQVLYTVICAREPLTVFGLSELLRIGNADRVRAALRPLWSVLHVVGKVELVTTLHASFPDFMFDPARSKVYHCDADGHNHKLAKHCFSRIQINYPQFNVCGLESSYMPDDVVPNIQDRIAKGISLDLFYACRYWADHVEAAKYTSAPVAELEDFLSKRLLLWMEIMNLKKEMRAGVECMRLIVRWCNGLKGEQALIELAYDAQRFVDAFARNAISQSTPHIYVSMLTFWPRSRPIAKHYGQLMDGPVGAEGTALSQRKLAHLATWTFEESISAVAVSPNGLFVALAFSTKHEVTVLDFFSGRVVLGPLHVNSHHPRIQSLAFSTDGSRILSASVGYDSGSGSIELVGWDAQTGTIVLGPISLEHNEYITDHAFSPDSTRLATAARKIRVWDAETGVMPLYLATQDVFQTVVFSPDGTRMAGGSNEYLYIWDTQTGTNILSPLVIDWVNKIAFSPDNCRIVHTAGRGKDNRMHVRNAHNGDLIHELDYRPIRRITCTCLEYSPNGMYIFGTWNNTVRVWDAQSGKVVNQLERHKVEVTSVAFSPDGSYIITGCEGGIVCIWDARQHSLASSPTTPSTRITSAKFSPNARSKRTQAEFAALDFADGRVASVSYDGTMCVCDTRSGEIVLGPLVIVQGNSTIDAIVYYSADRNHIVTGPHYPNPTDPEFNLWNAQTGDRILGPFTCPLTRVSFIYFALDGICFFGAHDGDIRTVVWSISTGEYTINSYGITSHSIKSLCCYPEGALIALATEHEITIVGDAYTETKILRPDKTSHRDIASVNFSPDGTCLVSGSDDGAIWIWDVETGEAMFELLHGLKDSSMTNAYYPDSNFLAVYSPDGSHILVYSTQRTICVHDARTAEERALSRSVAEYADWTIRPDGWVVDDQSRLLVWVPVDLQHAVMWPRTQAMVAPSGYVRLKFEKSRMGESWGKSYVSRL